MTLRRMVAGEYRPEPAFRLPRLTSMRSLAMLTAAALALGLLAFLLLVTQGDPIDPDLHSRRLEQLSTSAQLDTSLDQEFEHARLALETEPAGLAGIRQHIESARQALLRSFAAPELAGGVATALSAYLKAVQERDQLIGDVQGDLRDFVQRFDGMRQQSDAALALLQSEGSASLRRSAMSLVSAATSYSIQAAPANGAEVDELLSQVGSGIDQLAEPGRRATLKQFVASVQALRGSKDRLQGRLNQFHSIPAAAALQQLRGAYLGYSRAQDTKREHGRVILAVYAGALFLAFVVLALRLRKSFSDLDRANVDLEHANQNLEQGIADRTRDLSKALEDLRLQQAQLIQSEKMASLGQMVAGVAHEINTPLSYAQGNVQTVREALTALPRPDAEARESLSEADLLLADAEHGLERISELVLTLKDFSRVDRSRTEPFNVNDGLETALKICHNQLKQRIEVRRDYGDVPLIPCSPSQLNQVFLNLITNAAQAIEEAGSIVLSTRDCGDHVEIRVRDSGCGMDEDIQAHIFEPFFTTKPVGKGTGLGLSIVFRIIEDHHGTIAVRSAPGKGSEFVIALPAPRAKSRDASAAQIVAAGTP